MSPTITVASFFFFSFFFVRPQNVCVVDTFYRTTKSTAPASGIISELLQRVPPFVYSIFNVRYKTGRNYRVPPLNFFSALCDFFFEFSFVAKRSPSSFLIFCSKLKFQKAQRVSPFKFFGTMRLSKFSFFFENFYKKIFEFFKMSPKALLHFFDILLQTGFSESRNRPSFYNFKNFALFEP